MEIDAALGRVIAWIGEERFRHGAGHAWATAATTGRLAHPPTIDADPDATTVPHDVADLLFPGLDDPLPGADQAFRHAVALAVYRLMPAYGLLMYLPSVRTPEVLAVYGAGLRELLDDEDPRLANPVAYHLWCGDFEGPLEVSTWAWTTVTDDPDSHPRRLARVLSASGPVPWELKAGLLRRLHADPRWHTAVDEALEAARRDVHGQIDEADVTLWRA